MTINYNYKTTDQIITQTVTLGDDSTYENYVVGVHGTLHATDDEDDATTSRPAIFKTTPPSDIASSGDLTAFADLSEMPSSVTASAQAFVEDETIREQMAQDIINERNSPESAHAPWASDG